MESDLRWDWDYALHFGGGFVGTAVTVPGSPWWIPFLMVLVFLLIGIGRERMQHSHWTLHRWIEALAWPAGGLVAALVGLIV